jgi:hypothetical protein
MHGRSTLGPARGKTRANILFVANKDFTREQAFRCHSKNDSRFCGKYRKVRNLLQPELIDCKNGKNFYKIEKMKKSRGEN